ncbi:thermonuclease family protein [Archaeoglobus profundus]|uniref:Nuclease (SNase domain protein) n=1 Tax=Archaeoglobus profundus (strain DSM 5631 / JCM 9629 / NBRC 100127 / Av18) TaxID=572546 RepID=D2RH50_ARCPA|nr:thermonuclease family protein [Archaeoglobus profundus]ADB57625.1 nuclease (SNase domain protein) [Archaeoglobus profundus DSM 5631]
MRLLHLTVILALVFLGCLEYERVEKGVVVDVVDGDTIIVKIDGKIEKVRLIGVDTPEIKAEQNKPYEYDNITNLTLLAEWGLKAKEFAESYLDNKNVTLEFDPMTGYRDRYGRLLAYVYVNGTDFNALLLKEGYARVYVTKFKKLEYYLKLQEIAMKERRGLWKYAS